MITFAIILWAITIVGYIIFNLYTKNIKLEKIITNQNNFIKNVLSLADSVDKTAQKIDSTMWVSSDPELKLMFDDIKAMQENIKQFTSKL